MTAHPATDAKIRLMRAAASDALNPPAPERTYTQSEVEQFFAEAEKISAEIDSDESRTFQHAMNYAYLKGRFMVGGAR